MDVWYSYDSLANDTIAIAKDNRQRMSRSHASAARRTIEKLRIPSLQEFELERLPSRTATRCLIMFRSTILSLVFLTCLSACGRLALAIDVGTSEPFRQQEFEAWGTSLAWFGNSLGNWSDQQAHAEVMDLLFDGPNNLGLNYARYNIGGGQNRLLLGNFRPGAAVPGWVPDAPSNITDSSTWQWDWDADPGQRKSLDEAIARGVTRVDAISYSAPYWMTNSQDTAGAVGGGDNLQTSLYDEFAHYQTEVLKHFRDERGIRFGTFNPMNEPHASWWQAGGQQEGMHVSQGFNQRLLIETVGQTLADKGLDTGIAAGDEFSANTSVSAFNQYNATTRSYVRQLNTHVYGGTGSNSTASMQSLRALADTEGWSLYQSEYGNNSTTGLLGGIGLANRITTDINVMGVNGWTYWQAVEPVSLSGAGWGLLWADYSINGDITDIRKQYHVMRQFTSHIRPGASILSVSDPETVAAHNPGSNSTVLVFTNDESTADTNMYNLLDGPPTFTRAIRTDNNGNFVSLGPGNVSGGQITVNSPGTAVTTIVAYHQPNLIQNANFANGGLSWQTSGNATFDANVDNTHDGSGGILLFTNNSSNAGAAWQAGIGDAATDLTGKAYEFSADLLFQNDSLLGQNYDADTHIALEFYGADGQTLTHASQLDFAELARPLLDDSEYRVFRTAVVQAPAGTRFVRPVVRFGNTASGSNGVVYLDNAYLQETRYVPRARTWKVDADGPWSNASNWHDDALIANNKAAYFGPNISAARTITLDSSTSVTGMTFDSEHGYHLTGSATLTIGNGESIARVDARSGSHSVETNVVLGSDVEIQVVGDAKLTVTNTLNLGGMRLTKTGPGLLTLENGFDMNQGILHVEANLIPSVSIGNNASLDGTLEVSLAPGQQVTWGSLYTLADFGSASVSFDSISLPNLNKQWLAWDVRYLESRQLVAEVINRADFNRDGQIDQQDLSQWSSGYGANDDGDINGDGTTNGADFMLWQRAFSEEAETNTLALVVDPVTGNAQIENLSATTFTIDAYTISSSSGSLLTSWDSLSDQSVAGWVEALPSAARLSELNPTDSTALNFGDQLGLIGLFNALAGQQDLEFQFRDTTMGTVNGRVIYRDLSGAIAATHSVPEPSVFVPVLVGTALLGNFRVLRIALDLPNE